MYHTLRVQSFRGLRDLKLENLGKVNLLVGSNNVGKTSLLEAGWLLQGPSKPSLVMNIANFRGLQHLTPAGVMNSLFRETPLNNSIKIEGTDSIGRTELLSITLSKAARQDIGTAAESMSTGVPWEQTDFEPPASLILQYNYVTGDGVESASTLHFVAGRPVETVNRIVSKPSAIMLSARRMTTTQDTARRFTKLQDSEKLQLVIDILRKTIEPRLLSMYLGYETDGPLIRARLEGLSTPLLFPLLGGGFVRLAEILLAIPEAENGVAFIDEIENGLYYETLERAWKATDAVRAAANTQVFATTHSLECVRAAVSAFGSEHADDFRLFRLERKNGDVRVITYDHETAQAALQSDLEVR